MARFALALGIGIIYPMHYVPDALMAILTLAGIPAIMVGPVAPNLSIPRRPEPTYRCQMPETKQHQKQKKRTVPPTQCSRRNANSTVSSPTSPSHTYQMATLEEQSDGSARGTIMGSQTQGINPACTPS